MPDHITCPGCGVANASDAVACIHCNFPLAASATPAAVPADNTVPAPPAAPDVRPFDPGPRPVRPRRARGPAMEPVQMQLWLLTAVAAVLGMVYFAAQGFWKSNAKPVEGAKPEQQQQADLARDAIAKDSTNLAARIALANVLYDTGNWSEAIIHYKSAARMDPLRPTTLVDMGVCYYNLSRFAAAESLFQHALLLDPNQPVALFNLGIVAESQEHYPEAQAFYQRAGQTNPPDAMKQPLAEHLKAVTDKLGKGTPPVPGSR